MQAEAPDPSYRPTVRPTVHPLRPLRRSKRPPARKPAPATASAPLPVIDICNNMITVTNYLSAVGSCQLPAQIEGNPSYQQLATQFSDWQALVWEQFWEGLLNAGIVAQAQEINRLIQIGITQQSVFQSVVNPSGGPVPTVVSLCDDMTNQVTMGNSYVTQLVQVAQSIQGADEQKVAQIQQIVNTLNQQFDQQEDQLSEDAIDDGKEVVVTAINVGVQTAIDEDPIEPLIEGIAKIGANLINQVILTSEINQTLSQLEAAWTALDQATEQLAQIQITINCLDAVVGDTSSTLAALDGIVTDWQAVCTVINDSPSDWSSTGLAQITEWAARMNQVSFAGSYKQTVSST